MINFKSFHGTVTMISDFITGEINEEKHCYKIMTVENSLGSIVNFVVSPTTYFVDHQIVRVGDRITGYYDGNAPVPLIYPPQYRALVIVKENPYQSVKVDYFGQMLKSSDGTLLLNIPPYTPILLINGQPFSGDPTNRNLIVIYGPSTKSFPAQTTPYKIIVWC
ncbi:hypothetical protein JOC85_002633 [Bacillus mesophilus]|uniref:Uncharacterized protein n=1 Tax=Bacillus mesophilus TaxID=1808955 RepID=A0A6M0Q8X5_9BACI|nr:hypothetical protein [Bacillus mesophilus]MBM7661826.1 hypothetical protein [Bacillus mesophilus]NEY72812.1 hypothetical protein [Bacillus mesophilus]